MIKFEDDNIEKIYLGDSTIKKIYLGSNMIYPDYIYVSSITLSEVLNTGITVGSNTEIQAYFFKKTGAASSYLYYSDSSSSLSTNLTSWLASGGNWRFGNRTISITTSSGVWINSKQNRYGVWFGDTSQGSYSTVSNFTSTNKLSIGALGTGIRYIKVYRYSTRELVADFRAIKQISTGYFGLLDVISNTFYVNSNNTGWLG